MFFYGLLFSIVFHGEPAQSQAMGERCLTPERTIGRCVDIRQCPRLLQLLQGPRPLPTDTVEYLRKVQCGFQGHNPLVCCMVNQPAKKTTTKTTPKTTTPRTTTPVVSEDLEGPVDVSRHPALRLLPRSCGPITEDRITGGNVTSLYEYPWMALLGYTSYDSDEVQYRCGGSLINNRYVLSAAHCVINLPNLELVHVRLGEYDLRTKLDCDPDPDIGCSPPALDIPVDRVISHDDYTKDELTHDIAIIRLKTPVQFTVNIMPICLPVGDEQRRTLENEKVTVTGWGATEDGTGSNVLLKIDLPIIPRLKCASIYNKAVPVTEQQMCAGGLQGKDSCGGDSGGPLQFVGQPVQGGLSYIQYGIVSFGPRQCGTAGRPGVYTRVGYYMDWILDKIRP